MKKSSAKMNYLYNLMFQLFSLITPIITTPYIARVLSPAGVGEYAFAASVNSYLCLAAALGFSTYGQREIAKTQGDINKQSAVFWEIFICKLALGCIVFILNCLLIWKGVFGDYTLLLKIMSIEVISTSINISFFFQGNEKFGLIALRDFIIRLMGIVLVFSLVKKPADLWIYALCNVGTSICSAASLWIPLRKWVLPKSLSHLHPFRHFFPSIKLFIPTIAISIYTILDKTLIGILIPGTIETSMEDGTVVVQRLADVENGFYAQSEKIIKMAMTVLSSLGTVMMPRNAKELADGHEDIFLRNINEAIRFVLVIGMPICTGIIAVASNFAPWFFGSGYEKVPVLMSIFSLMIVPAGLGNVLGQQYLIPKGEDLKYAIVYAASAGVNFFLNMVLIPRYYSYGAAVASVIAEMIAPLIMVTIIKKESSLITNRFLRDNIKPIIASIGMLICVAITKRLLSPSIISTFILVVEGITVYFFLLLVLGEKTVSKVVSKSRRRKKNQ